MNIVFENENFVIVDKPVNVLSTPPRFKDDREILGITLEKELKIQIFPVNRLDAEVSGLVVYAKNANAHREANKWFENHLIKKHYQALANPTLEYEQKSWLHWKSKLLRGKKRAYESPHGKESETLAYLYESTDKSQWILSPLTGRSHQLRYEMYKHQVPILGDLLYSGTKISEEGIKLRSFRLDLSNITENLRFGLPEKIEIFGFFNISDIIF